jgi:hypothetical protein
MKRLVILLTVAFILTMQFGTKLSASYPPADNEWSDFVHYGFSIICPNSNPEVSCDISVYYRVKRIVENGVYSGGEIEIEDFDYPENCPCIEYLEEGIIKALLEAECPFLQPTRTPGDYTWIENINIKLPGECLRKHYYYKQPDLTKKYFRYISCGTQIACENYYAVQFYQPMGISNPAFAEMRTVILESEVPESPECVYYCEPWCGNFALTNWDPSSPVIVPGLSSERYTGQVTPVIIPKISLDNTIEEVTINPNPAGNLINIKFNANTKGEIKIKLIDISGNIQSVTNSTICSGLNSCTVDTKALINGAYTIILTLNDEILSSEKVMIKH